MKKLLFSLIAIILSVTSFSQQNVSISQQEKAGLLFMREEEKLARDVYELLYTKWDTNPFGNIRQSEQTHMDKMKFLISTYNLTDPVENNKDKPGVFTSTLLQQYYNELAASGSQSLTDALKAGAKIEELDIADLEENIKQTKKQDILSTYSYLKMASENHLRAFVRRLNRQGINYEPVILTKSSFDRIIVSDANHSGSQWQP